jgi:3-deoxy-manno-octulosonate cytidylyltransferase (CMP-KDO synthetase)
LYEVAQNTKAEVYINVQGDEPLIKPSDIQIVLKAAENNPHAIFNAMCSIVDEKDFRSPNVPKVVARPDGRLLYMSRAPIPTNKAHEFKGAMKQVCIYAIPREALLAFGRHSKKTPLETTEDVEILRFLELGHEVRMLPVSGSSIAVDTPENLNDVTNFLNGT